MKRACSDEQMLERRKEIVEAAKRMLSEMDYQDISMKAVSERISIARPSLYCYYRNVEEIMLDVLRDDFVSWADGLSSLFKSGKMAPDELAGKAAEVYLSHPLLLKMVSTYLSEIETHVRLERLVCFKKALAGPVSAIDDGLRVQFPEAAPSEIDTIHVSLMMLNHGLYPVTSPTPNQAAAMKEANMRPAPDPKGFCVAYLKALFEAFDR
jgi:AcrR family transcriptional regulator